MPQETAAGDKVLYAVDERGVATITLNDPDTRNALSGEMLGGLLEAFERARDSDEVRCVVLASSHERTFSSGANLGGFAAEAALVHKHFDTRALRRVVPVDRRPRQADAVHRSRPRAGGRARHRAVL